MGAREEVKIIAGLFDNFARILKPADSVGHDMLAVRGPNVAVMKEERFEQGLDYAAAIKAAERLQSAVEALAAAKLNKDELPFASPLPKKTSINSLSGHYPERHGEGLALRGQVERTSAVRTSALRGHVSSCWGASRSLF